MSSGHSLAYLSSLSGEGKRATFTPNGALGEIFCRASNPPAGEKIWLQKPSSLIDSWDLPGSGMPWPSLLNSLMRLSIVFAFLLWAFSCRGWWLALVGGLLLSALGGLLSAPFRVAPEAGVLPADLGLYPLEESKLR